MIEGLDELKQMSVDLGTLLNELIGVAKETARKEMGDVRTDAIARTPIDSGEARRSWSSLIEDADTLYFELNVPYGFALDVGSEPGNKPWPSPGPKTELYKGSIFSSQVADGEGGITAEVFSEERQVEIMGNIANSVMAQIKKRLL